MGSEHTDVDARDRVADRGHGGRCDRGVTPVEEKEGGGRGPCGVVDLEGGAVVEEVGGGGPEGGGGIVEVGRVDVGERDRECETGRVGRRGEAACGEGEVVVRVDVGVLVGGWEGDGREGGGEANLDAKPIAVSRVEDATRIRTREDVHVHRPCLLPSDTEDGGGGLSTAQTTTPRNWDGRLFFFKSCPSLLCLN